MSGELLIYEKFELSSFKTSSFHLQAIKTETYL